MTQVTIFTKPDCRYCDRAKAVIDYVGVKYKQYDVTISQHNTDASVYFSGVTTVPQIFVGDYHFNGAEDFALRKYLLKSDGNKDKIEVIGDRITEKDRGNLPFKFDS